MSLREVNDELDSQPEAEVVDEMGGHHSPPSPIYTYVLLASIIAVAIVQFAAGLDESVDAAGFVKPDFIRGQYWRIVTGAALHGGLAHIALNGYALYSFGRIFELLSNRAHLSIVFLLAAISGGVLSLLFVPEGRSVGASGGIVGLLSYLAVYAFKRYQFISPEFRRSLLINIGFIIVFGLALYQIVDNWGHIGGLLAGAVYGLIQIPRDPYVNPGEAGGAASLIGLACLCVFVAASIFSIFLIFRQV